MKKLISLLMALVMVLSMAPAAFADENESIVLFDTVATTKDADEACDGVPFETVAPGDGNITISFDENTDVVPEYQVIIDGDKNAEWKNCLYDGPYTNTYMVSEGDTILVKVCTQINGDYAAGSIHFTLVYTPVEASTEVETISGTASFETAAAADDGKVINYTASTTGTLTLNLVPYDNIGIEWKIEVNGSDKWYDTFSGSSTTQSVELVRGDSVEILISTADGYKSDGTLNYAPGTVDYELVFTPSEGGEGGEDVTDTVLELGENEIKLGAGESYSLVYTFVPEEDGFLSLDVTGLIMHSPFEGTKDVSDYSEDFVGGAIVFYVNGESYFEPISVTAGVPVEIYLYQNRMYSNYGYAWDMLLSLSIETGADSRPEDAVSGTVVIDEEDELWMGVIVSFTAPSEGEVTLNLSYAEGLVPEYKVTFNEYGIDAEGDWYNGFIYDDIDSKTFKIYAGETVYFTLYLHESSLFDGGVFGNIDYEIVFTPSEGGSVEIGEVIFFIDEGEEYSGTFIFTPEQDGLLYIDFIDLSAYSPANGDEDCTDFAEEILGGTIYLYVNGESYIGNPISVTAGVPVEIYMTQAPRYMELNYSWYAAVLLSVNGAGSAGDTTVEIGEATFFIDEGQEYSNVYTFTPEQDGLLYIDFTDLSACSPANGDEDCTDFAEEILGGHIYLYVNEESYIGNPISVTAGVPVEIYMTQSPRYMGLNYSWYAAVSLSIKTAGGAGDTTVSIGETDFFINEGEEYSNVYTFTPEQDGLLYIDFIDLSAYSPANGDEDCTDFAEEILGGTIYLYVNGESYIGNPIAVTAGVPVEIYMTQTPRYMELNYSWYAAVSLSLSVSGGNNEPSEPVFLEDGLNLLVVDEGEQNMESVYYYIATQDGILNIEALEVGYIEFGNSYQDVLDYFAEYVTVYVDGNALANITSDSIEVVEGQEIEIVLEKTGGLYAEAGFYVKLNLSYGAEEPSVLCGDVTGDGIINVFDANLVCRAAIGLVELTEEQKAAADVNGDGSINVFDANYICRYAIGLITGFPAAE